MKILCIISLLFSFNLTYANQIDSLKTIKDVNAFLASKVDKGFETSPLLEANGKRPGAPGKKIKNKFYKVDIDNDKLTDLVIDGYALAVVLDKGNNHYEIKYLKDSREQVPSLVAIDSAKTPKKLIIHPSREKDKLTDTLVYLYSNFIEFNANPDVNFSLEKIKFTTQMCFGRCPAFEMTIAKDKKVIYRAGPYNDEEGDFTGVISDNEFNALIGLLRYIQIAKLKSNYSVGWTDDATALVVISYNNRTKTIRDYGEIGTYGLAVLYSRFFAYRKSIKWSKKE